MSTICLNMIVKNESQCISKCLDSVKQFIDYYVICDTGSTDNTEEVVRKTLDGIPGEYHNCEWKDFSTNRNQAIKLAKDKADYILIIDADDHLVVEKSTFNNLKELVYKFKIIHSNIVHYRPHLIHNSLDFKYVGVVHEYLDLPFYVNQTILPNCSIVIGHGGSRSQDPEKFIKDAHTLEEALKDEPTNTRYVFYCAQSYRDCGDTINALRYYMTRTAMGGWSEERYCSYLEAGKLMERLRPDDVKNITVTYLKGHECNPERVECLCYLSMYYRKLGLLSGAYAFAKMGTTISKPTEALFLEPDCYDWKIWDEAAVAGFYVGKKEEATTINRKLLASSKLPVYARSRIVTNLEFCEGKK